MYARIGYSLGEVIVWHVWGSWWYVYEQCPTHTLGLLWKVWEEFWCVFRPSDVLFCARHVSSRLRQSYNIRHRVSVYRKLTQHYCLSQRFPLHSRFFCAELAFQVVAKGFFSHLVVVIFPKIVDLTEFCNLSKKMNLASGCIFSSGRPKAV